MASKKRGRAEVAWTVVPRPENGGPKMFEFPVVTDRLFEVHDGQTNKWEHFSDFDGALVNVFTLMVRADQLKLEEGKEKNNARDAEWYQKNKKKKNASGAEWYQNHKEQIKAHREEHKGDKKAYDAERYQRKKKKKEEENATREMEK